MENPEPAQISKDMVEPEAPILHRFKPPALPSVKKLEGSVPSCISVRPTLLLKCAVFTLPFTVVVFIWWAIPVAIRSYSTVDAIYE
jgi:hypothetical protein